MNPIQANQDIENRLRSYIRYSLPIERAAPEFTPKLDAFFSEYRMVRDPYLELVPQYAAGRTLRELADAGVIHEETARIFAKAFNQDDASKVRLYSHQDKALQAVCQRDENLIVCSGTGSGKTESFLIPLVDKLVKQWVAEGRPERLSPGVRALILYPMNALVNDQVRRLRRILREAPFITFGQYVGETAKESNLPDDFIAKLPGYEKEMLGAVNETKWDGKLGFDDQAPLANEHRVRAQWDEPANILVTNYSMLERILLAPDTSIIFGDKWKYIILDEAHSYTGAVGTEIAWLMRRIKRRVEANGCPVSELRYLATSATLISDPKLTEEQKAAQIRDDFATKLFPAGNHSFSVLFGELKQRPQAPSQFRLTAGQYVKLAGSQEQNGLLQKTIEFEARASWILRLKTLVEGLPADETLNAGIAIHVLDQVYAALKCLHEFGESAELDPCPFDNDTAPTIHVMLKLVGDGIEQIDEPGHPKLKELLPEMSGDEIIREWRDFDQEKRQTLSFEAFKHLFRLACGLVASAAEDRTEDVLPQDLRIVLTEEAWSQLKEFRSAVETATHQIYGERNQLLSDWRSFLPSVNPDTPVSPHSERAESLLADYLSHDGRVHLLAQELETSLKDPQSAKQSALSEVAKTIFAPDPALDQQAATEALIRLAGFAIPHGERHPLLDLRYHQIARGLNPVAITFTAGEETGRVADFTLAEANSLQGQKAASYGLGLCRDCGHPFAIAYAESPLLGQDARLVREESTRFFHLHAFAWHKHHDNSSDTSGLAQSRTWFNALQTRVKQSEVKPVGEGWVLATVTLSPDKVQDPAFLPKCPFCGAASSHNRRGAKFGKITPYELSRDQVRNVILDELSALADSSLDPIARSMPGKGRKILAFSDSRQSAAKLASKFEQFLDDVNTEGLVAHALHEAAKGRDSIYKEQFQKSHSLFGSYRAILEDEDFDSIDRERKLEKAWQRYKPDLEAGAIALVAKLEQHRAKSMLEAYRIQPAQAGWEVNAAGLIILKTLREKGRNSFLKKHSAKISSKSFEAMNGDQPPNQEWVKFCKKCALEPSDFSELLEELVLFFLQDAALTTNAEEAKKIDAYPPPLLTKDWFKSEAVKLAETFFIGKISQTTTFAEVIEYELLLEGQTNELALSLASRSPQQLQHLAKIAFQSKLNGNDWLELLAAMNAQKTTLKASEVIQKRLRKCIQEQAGRLLGEIWKLCAATNAEAKNNVAMIIQAEDAKGFVFSKSDLIIRLDEEGGLEEAIAAEQVEVRRRSGMRYEPVYIEEHTAQISNFKASMHQAGFAEGSVNILSCSTTFEMGVDLGELNCVFLANLPPEAANYRQRAGRAGRRPGASAYVLTVMSNTPHDRYYWQEPTKLMFGAMTPPVIYLDNQVMRARHLRAEALHHFLTWHTGTNVQNHNWLFVGDCLLGEGFTKTGIPLNTFDPICSRFHDWVNDSALMHSLNTHVSGIEDTEGLDYNVAHDLAWQMIGKPSGVAPYPMDESTFAEKYLNLGGPNQPEVGNGQLQENKSIRRHSVEKQIRDQWRLLPAGKPRRRFARSQTITWLSRLRVLPKYGFPVDVIQLLPDDADSSGMAVSLERDLQIGLYEYAPGRVVFANKRIFKSKLVLAKELNKYATAAPLERPICDNPSCREPSWDGSDGAPCPICGEGTLLMVPLVQPDAFRAEISTSARSAEAWTPEGTRMHVHTGYFKDAIQVPGIRLSTQESLSGVITLLNRGPNYHGFSQNGQTFSLYHEVHTDIVAWRPDHHLFEKGGFFVDLKNDKLQAHPQRKHQSRNRLTDSFRSALHAILRATARVLGVDPQGFDGLIHLEKDGSRSFVLFDTSSGGTGILLDLVMKPGSPRNEWRARLVREVLQEAINLCEHCPTCESGTPSAETPDAMPIPKVDYDSLDSSQAAKFRPQQACYDCLKSFSNQRHHDSLDRLDAARVLRGLIEP